jgi:hypothetical protein
MISGGVCVITMGVRRVFTGDIGNADAIRP